MNSHVGRINLNIGFSAFEHAVVRLSLGYRSLNAQASEIGDLDLGTGRQAHDVGIVELNFCPRFFSGRDLVAAYQGSIDARRSPPSGVATLHGNIAMDQADVANSRRRLFGRSLGMGSYQKACHRKYKNEYLCRHFHSQPHLRTDFFAETLPESRASFMPNPDLLLVLCLTVS